MRKKRYILSALVSALFFTILYVVLKFNILIALILTFACYFGCILLFKEKDVRKYDPDTIMHYCYLISKISNYANYIDDKMIVGNINDITREAEKIIVMLEQKPAKVTQVYDGFDFFLPNVIKVIEQYIYLMKQKKLKDPEKEFLGQVNNFLDNVETEMVKMLDNMNYRKMLDINSSIEVFKKGNDLVKDGVEDGSGR